MRKAPGMPELIEDQSVSLVHRSRDLTPCLHLLAAWMPGVQA
jgi:hypothetical protein